jgi:hypothetical protein
VPLESVELISVSLFPPLETSGHHPPSQPTPASNALRVYRRADPRSLHHIAAGSVPRGLQYTPCGKYTVYPLGSMIVVRNLALDTQCFLEGHNNVVSALCISHDGKKLASGEVGLTAGTKVRNATVVVWE